jgi:hypothetical protein
MSEDLIAQITTAFAHTAYPGDDDLARGTYGTEPPAVARAFRGKRRWQALTAAFLDDAPEGWQTALSFLSDRAFHFFLPAYLVADVRGELAEVAPPFHLCYGLTARHEHEPIADMWGGGTLGDSARRRMDHFSTEQARAVVAYLTWSTRHAPDPEVTEAITRYWTQRTTRPT